MRTKKRSKLQVTAGALAALVLVNVIAMVAFTRSTTPPPPGSTLAGKLIIPPENEAAEHAAGRADAGRVPGPQAELERATSPRRRSSARRRRPPRSRRRRHGLAWKQLGPYNIGGRVTDVVADRFTPNSAFAAVSGGGIWKTTDGGANWTSIWPDANTQTMGAFAQAPDGTLWAGTGEANPPGGGLTYFGDGIYKSTDNGAHWTNMGLTRERVDRAHRGRPDEPATASSSRPPGTSPAAPSSAASTARATAARRGSSCSPRRTRRPARSTSRSTRPTRRSSTRRCGTTSAPTARAPTAASAPACSAPRTAATRGSGWRTSSTRCRPTTQTQTGLKADASLGRIGVAIAPSNPNRVYVVFGDAVRPGQGLLLSNDGGDTSRTVRRPRRTRPTAATSGGSAASGSTRTTRTTSSTPTSTCARRPTAARPGPTSAAPHADQHGMDWDPSTLDGNPATPNRVFLGNDGGMYRSDDQRRQRHRGCKATNQPWNQALPPRGLPAATRTASSIGPAGQRLRTRPGRATGPVADRSGAARLELARAAATATRTSIDPTDDNFYYTCSQSSGGGTHSCSGRRDTATATHELHGRQRRHSAPATATRPTRRS